MVEEVRPNSERQGRRSEQNKLSAEDQLLDRRFSVQCSKISYETQMRLGIALGYGKQCSDYPGTWLNRCEGRLLEKLPKTADKNLLPLGICSFVSFRTVSKFIIHHRIYIKQSLDYIEETSDWYLLVLSRSLALMLTLYEIQIVSNFFMTKIR